MTAFRPDYRYNEFKYVVQPRCLATVRRLLQAQSVEPDPFPAGRVQSIYYDTIEHTSLGQCRDGAGRKIKFRIRRYDELADGQLQVKFKDGFAVAKLKAAVPFVEPPPQAWPFPEDEGGGAGGGGSAASAIATLARTAATLRPALDVRYRRERFRWSDDRVTLDSGIHAYACTGWMRVAGTAASVDYAVLEVKSRSEVPRLPPGLRGLVSFASFSKYGLLLRALLDEADVTCKYAPS